MPSTHSKLSNIVELPLGKTPKELWNHFIGSITSTWRGKLLISLWGLGAFVSLVVGLRKRLAKKPHRDDSKRKSEKGAAPKGGVTPILKIAFPSLFCKSTFFLILYSVSMFIRILLTIKIARITGKLGKMVGARTFTRMFHLQAIFSLWCFPAAFINTLMNFGCNHLSLAIREQLLSYLHKKYLTNLLFYRANNVGRVKMDDVDQRITQDLKRFSSQIAELYGNLLKPVLELILISQTLAKLMGGRQLMGFFAYFLIAGQWLQFVMPRFAEMTAEHARLEGEFRAHHQRLITHSEEIAFYGGSDRERVLVDKGFQNVKKLDNKQFLLQLVMGMLDGYLVKYGASMVAYSMLIPAVYLGTQGLAGKSQSAIMEYYLTSTQLFIALGTACKNLVLSYKRIQSVTGLTVRINELLEMIKRKTSDADEKEMKALADANPEKLGGEPKIIVGDNISFDKVDIFSPAGNLLAKGLTFTVEKGTNVLISGPNGCGKSSLFRILGGLWPLCSGTLTRPKNNEMFYVPQRPYMVPGTLRDQVTYPKSISNNSEDARLNEIMELVQLNYVVEREGGWDSTRDWFNVLSGGEKQRVAMARLFYHKPAFGILDECTSAVSIDVEAKIYQTCEKLGITIFTVSHRPQLRHHHTFMLKFDGEGGWEWVDLRNEPK